MAVDVDKGSPPSGVGGQTPPLDTATPPPARRRWSATRIGVQALAATEGLDQARINTLALWDVDKINGGVRSIISSAEEARAALEGE